MLQSWLVCYIVMLLLCWLVCYIVMLLLCWYVMYSRSGFWISLELRIACKFKQLHEILRICLNIQARIIFKHFHEYWSNMLEFSSNSKKYLAEQPGNWELENQSIKNVPYTAGKKSKNETIVRKNLPKSMFFKSLFEPQTL